MNKFRSLLDTLNATPPRTLRGGVVLFWLCCYVLVLNTYHVLHVEQMQLFRFDYAYFHSFLAVPGGLADYAGLFLGQFFISEWLGALLLLALTAACWWLLRSVLRQWDVAVSAMWVVVLLGALQVSVGYPLGTSIAFLLIVAAFRFYLATETNNLSVYAWMLLAPSLLYMVCGGLVSVWLLLVLLNETRLCRATPRWKHSGWALVAGVILLMCASRFLYFLTPLQACLACLPFAKLNYLNGAYLASVILFLPFALALERRYAWIRNYRLKKTHLIYWIVFLLVFTGVSYEFRMEKLLAIEHYFQKEDYKEVVRRAQRYPGNNHLAVYWGNIALSKTNRIGDELFSMRQVYAQTGLTMKGEPVKILSLYGSQVYDHLHYYNEACHWSYESLVTNGATPYQLKKLIQYELVNNNCELAKKYLKLLGQSLFYKEWAKEYYALAVSPLMIDTNDELADMRRYRAYKDFYQDSFAMRLKALLTLYPANRAAFDYILTNALLKKDVRAFLDGLGYLREFPMRSLPRHYEEAILVCESVLPEEKEKLALYAVSDSTRQRFTEYVTLYQNARGKEEEVFKKLSKEFGDTFWFYLDFYPVIDDEQDSKQMMLY